MLAARGGQCLRVRQQMDGSLVLATQSRRASEWSGEWRYQDPRAYEAEIAARPPIFQEAVTEAPGCRMSGQRSQRMASQARLHV